eukprot:m.151854 g.151854  ORF g.151854 m.151854 type:complete len:318 (+) comp14258_c1_seq2:483-1436(+)
MDVVVVGSCNTDLISYVKRAPKPAETLTGERFEIGYGGKGANQCVMAARLGAKTAMVGKLGTDVFGNDTLKHFKDEGVNVTHLHQVEGTSTGVAPITVDANGQNSIIIVPGANYLLDDADLEAASEMIASAKVLVLQNEIRITTTVTALKMAQQHGVTSVMNFAPAVDASTLTSDHDCLFSLPTIFCVNEIEAASLTTLPVTTMEEATVAAKALQTTRGCKTVIITMGSLGSLICTTEGEVTVVPCEKVTAVDTTGAGDCFLGALAFFLATMPALALSEAVTRSGQVASLSVLRPGTQSSYPQLDELQTKHPALFSQ